jgi:predicted ferric reductase
MAQRAGKGSLWLLAVPGFVMVVLIVVLLVLVPYGTFVDQLIRVLALAAYLTAFASIIMTNYVREMFQYFGKPFMTIHHIASISALVLMIAHPVVVVFRDAWPGALLPQTGSVQLFFIYAGAPALYLFVIGVVAVLLRRLALRSWRYIHWLTYIAFILATVHAILLGANFVFLPVKIIAGLMAAASVLVFVLRRAKKRRRPRAA